MHNRSWKPASSPPSDIRDVIILDPYLGEIIAYHDSDWMCEGQFAGRDFCHGDHPSCAECNNRMCNILTPEKWAEIDETKGGN